MSNLVDSKSFDASAASTQSALQEAVASSPIVVCENASAPADWATIRQSADVDEFVLDWIVSHVRTLRRLHTA